MIPITLDFETYWTATFSLSKMSFVEYINSPDFEVLSVAVKIGDAPTTYVFGHDEVGDYLRSLDWSGVMAIAFNGNEFDFPLLKWVYGISPKLYCDVLCMARPLHQSNLKSLSLKNLSEFYGLPEKNGEIINLTRGKRCKDLSVIERQQMERYNIVDVDNTYELFRIFTPMTSSFELKLMDLTARSISEPQFETDLALLQTTLATVSAQKEQLLWDLMPVLDVDSPDKVKAALMSQPKFAAVLESYGVQVPTKISKTTLKKTFALAKTDQEFLDLQEHPDANVQMLVAARLGHKSTLLETRLQKMLTCGSLMTRMPVPLAYHSATTGRWGGRVWNPQNLPRIPRDKSGNVIEKPTNALRMALKAPPGHKVVVADLSGIELRVNHYLWMVQSTQAAFEKDPQADLYRTFASEHLYHVALEHVSKEQRQVAKVAQLGLGFGAGALTFQRVAKTMGGVDIDITESQRVVHTWRTAYHNIFMGWRKCDWAVRSMLQGAHPTIDPRGLCRIVRPEIAFNQFEVLLPSGRRLFYPHLRVDPATNQVIYGVGRNTSKLYAGLFDENLVQAIARDVISYHALKVQHLTGRVPALMVHDELVYIVPDDEAEEHLNLVLDVMKVPPKWLPGIILWAEGDLADRYGEAK